MHATEARRRALAAQSRESYDFKKIMELIELRVKDRELVYKTQVTDDQTHKGIVSELKMLGYSVSYSPSNELIIRW